MTPPNDDPTGLGDLAGEVAEASANVAGAGHLKALLGSDS